MRKPKRGRPPAKEKRIAVTVMLQPSLVAALAKAALVVGAERGAPLSRSDLITEACGRWLEDEVV
jgi:hypothetical protein